MKITYIYPQERHESPCSGPAVSIGEGRHSTTRLHLIVWLVFTSLFSSLAAYGQTDTATILGTVSDPSGAVLPNTEVTIVNVGTNAKTTVRTEGDGSYIATPLRIGTYTVGVEAPGFRLVSR